MTSKVLVVGASGRVGSATVRASLARGHETIAFLRTPSKLPSELASNPLCRIYQGDAKNAQAIGAAIRDHAPLKAIILTAPLGEMLGKNDDYTKIANIVIRAVHDAQMEQGSKIRFWIMAGAAVLEHPDHPGKFISDVLPMKIYPAYDSIVAYLETSAKELDWTMNCPAMIKADAPQGPLVVGILNPPLFKPRGFLTRYLPLGTFFNTFYNFSTTRVTYQGLADYMIDHLDLDSRIKGKRIGILEDPSAVLKGK